MRPNLAGTIGVLVLASTLLAAANQVQAVRERSYPVPQADDDVLYMASRTAVPRLAGPYRALTADLYWIRTIQYYGNTKRRLAARSFPQDPPPPPAGSHHPEYLGLYQLLDLTTDLDPNFDVAYRFGAVFLAEAFPAGAGRPDLATKLLEKGLRERPDKWEYMQDIGFVHYWYGHDYRQAALWFDRAGSVPGAPRWLKPLAATTLAQGGDRGSSKTMWEAILASTEVDWLRAAAERHLLQLRAFDELEQLQVAVDALGRRNGSPVANWAAVVRSRLYPGIPVDPTGTRYELADGKVRLSATSGLFPLPVEPERHGPS